MTNSSKSLIYFQKWKWAIFHLYVVQLLVKSTCRLIPNMPSLYYLRQNVFPIYVRWKCPLGIDDLMTSSALLQYSKDCGLFAETIKSWKSHEWLTKIIRWCKCALKGWLSIGRGRYLNFSGHWWKSAHNYIHLNLPVKTSKPHLIPHCFVFVLSATNNVWHQITW